MSTFHFPMTKRLARARRRRSQATNPAICLNNNFVIQITISLKRGPRSNHFFNLRSAASPENRAAPKKCSNNYRHLLSILCINALLQQPKSRRRRQEDKNAFCADERTKKLEKATLHGASHQSHGAVEGLS